MKIKMYGKLAVILAMLLMFTWVGAVNAYVSEDGSEATILRIKREFSSTSSKVGKVETITYHITGDTIVYEPPKEIALVVDVSPSMDSDIDGKPTWDPAKRRINILKEAAKNFVEKWKGKDCKICVVPFSTTVKKTSELFDMKESGSLAKLNSYITNLTTEGYTNIGDGMRVAYHTLLNSGASYASKYIITLTDGNPNTSSINNDGTYFVEAGIAKKTQYDTSKAMEYCTTYIGDKIFSNTKFKSFVIGFATAKSMETNLDNIGIKSGAAELDNGKHFYHAGSSTELNQVYSDISDIISKDVPLTDTTFSELLPVGTVIEPEAVDQLKEQGFKIINDCPDPDDPKNKVRTKITKALNDYLVLEKKYPEATAAPKSITYQLKPYSFSITIMYDTPGTKVFKDVDASVVFDDPFMDGNHTSHAEMDASVVVIQPVTGISKTDTFVMPDQIGEPGMIYARVLPNVAPNIAYDESIATWTVKDEKDELCLPAAPGSILSISEPAEPNPLNNTRIVKALKAGRAAVEAISAGDDLNGSPIHMDCYVFAADAVVDNIKMNKGDIVDLNKCARPIFVVIDEDTGAEKMVFSNWRLKNPADAEYIDVKQSGTAEAIKSLTGDIPVLVDVDYTVTVGSPGSPDFFELHRKKIAEGMITMSQSIKGVSVEGAVLMAGSGSGAEISAEVQPEDAYNKKINSWKFINESGQDVTGSNPIAEITTVAGDGNNSKRNVKGTGCGKLTVVVETDGYNAGSERMKAYNTIFVADAECDKEKTITLWSSGVSIGTVSHMPSGLLGDIRFRFALANPSDSSKLTVNGNTGEISGLQLTTDTPVPVTVSAEYFDGDGNATGRIKTFTCMVNVAKPDIDIN